MTRRIALLVAVAASLALASDAFACSCAPLDVREALAHADGAFVGILTDRVVEGEEAVHTFRVETPVKGEIGSTVEVRSHRDGATCGLEIPIGWRVGLLVTKDGPGWRASLCDQVLPEELLAAAEPLPAPSGSGPAALLVGGSFGEVRTIALDELGRVVAYGEGDGDTVDLSVCPGKARAVELVAVPGEESPGYRLEVRDLRSMEVVTTLAPVSWRDDLPASIRCLAPDGLEAGVLVRSWSGPERLLSVGVDTVRVIWRGEAAEGRLGLRRAYLCLGARGRTAAIVSLATGTERAIARLPRLTGPLTPGPGGRFLAGVAVDWGFADPQPARVVLVDSKSGTVRTAPLGGPYVTAGVLWLRRDRLVVVPSGGGLDRVRVFDQALRERGVGELVVAQDAALLDGSLIGLIGPFLFVASPPTGPFEELARLPSPVGFVLEAVSRAPGGAGRAGRAPHEGRVSAVKPASRLPTWEGETSRSG